MTDINHLVKLMFEDIHIHYAGGGGDVVSDNPSSSSSSSSSKDTQDDNQSQQNKQQSQQNKQQPQQPQQPQQQSQPNQLQQQLQQSKLKKPTTSFVKPKKNADKEEKKSVFVRNHIRMLGRRPSPAAMHQRFGSFT